MKLKKIDKHFWEIFKICPRQACLSYYKNNKMFSRNVVTYKFKTIEEQKFTIYELTTNLFFKKISETGISVKEIKLIFLSVINKRFKLVNNSKRYSEDYKEKFNEMIEELKTFVEFEDYLKMLDPRDAKNIFPGLEIECNIKDYINKNYIDNRFENIKDDFIYELEIPFYKKEDNKVKVIKYINDGIPFSVLDFNSDLIILSAFFKKGVGEELNSIIVYDFKTMKRVEIKPLLYNFKQVYSKLRIIENGLIYMNTDLERCKNCPHLVLCYNHKQYSSLSFEELKNGRKN